MRRLALATGVLLVAWMAGCSSAPPPSVAPPSPAATGCAPTVTPSAACQTPGSTHVSNSTAQNLTTTPRATPVLPTTK
jgi:hypothetical protein